MVVKYGHLEKHSMGFKINVDHDVVDKKTGWWNMNIKIEPIRADISRVRVSLKELKEYRSELIREKIEPIEHTDLHAEIDSGNGSISWNFKERTLLKGITHELVEKPVYRYTTDGEEPIIDRVKTVDGERNFIKNLKKKEVRKAYSASITLTLQDDEGIYGLGQAEEGIYNLRHQTKYLYQHNMRIPMPVLFSDKGYGILVDCSSLMEFYDTEDGASLYLDTVDEITYYFIAAENAGKFTAAVRFLTGKASMLPDWAYGYVQSKEQYYSAAEMRDVVKRYRELKVPIDCIVQDWNSWRPEHWGEKKLDEARYSDVKERMEEIHDMNVHTMISVWPNMNSNTDDYAEFMSKGFLLNDLATYDAFNEEARKLYWKQAKEGLYDKGFDSWWCDSTEPFSGPDWGGSEKKDEAERYKLVGGEHKKYLDPEKANVYALYHAKGIYENQRKDDPEKRVLNLTRSGYISGQKYGAMLWSGDTAAKWDTLKKQITEGLNMGLSGYPYWTLDIGAFFTVGDKWQNRGCGCNNDPSVKWFWQGDYNEGVKDAGYRELYVRWLEFGCFLPMFRSHGTDTPREIWNFGAEGDPAYDAIKKYIGIRYLLMPYIYSMAAAVYHENYTIMRSFLFDFIEDSKARNRHDEFMFGESILVCPVTEPMYYLPENKKIEMNDAERGRKCYLPKGTGLTDFFNGDHYEGGQDVFIKTPLDKIPVFVRDGSIIPMQEGLDHASDRPLDELIITVYPGCDGSYTLYEDVGNGYGYEKGEFSAIDFRWTDRGDGKHGVLHISDRKGRFPGMPVERVFRIRIKGMEERVVAYTGESIQVDLTL